MASKVAAAHSAHDRRQPRVCAAAAPRLSRWRVPTPLALLLVAGALLSVAWNVALPPLQGTDEVGHLAYVEHMAHTGAPPPIVMARTHVSGELARALTLLGLEPLVDNLNARPAWSAADLALWRGTAHVPASATRTAGPSANQFARERAASIAKNPPLYYALMAPPDRALATLPLPERVFALRLCNGLLYLATIVLAWLLAAELFGGARLLQTLAAGAAALQPQLAFMSAVINADSLLIALTTGFLLAAVRLALRGPSARRIALASLLACAACATQGRGLVTLPVLLVALAVSVARHRPRARSALAGLSLATVIVGGAFAFYQTLLSGRDSSSLYGGQVSALNSGAFHLGGFLSFVYQFYLPRLGFMHPRIGPAYGYRQVFIETFYGTFGGLQVVFSQQVFDVLQALTAVGLVGLAVACVARRDALRRRWPAVAVMAALLVVSVGFLHYASYRALLGDGGTDPLIVGRYLLPMVALFGLAIAFCVSALPRALRAPSGAALLSLGTLLSLAGLGLTIATFYG